MCSAGVRRRAAHPYEVDDETGPLSVYGRTKLAGEFDGAGRDARRAHRPDRVGLRGAGGNDFVAAMRSGAGDGPVEVVADQVGAPTYVGDLVGALLEVADGAIANRAARGQRG